MKYPQFPDVLQMALNSPIRQGQTRYQFLVMQFSREEEMSAELNLTE
jgi:structure-specific recognition protein 1